MDVGLSPLGVCGYWANAGPNKSYPPSPIFFDFVAIFNVA